MKYFYPFALSMIYKSLTRDIYGIVPQAIKLISPFV